jgi:hypothetical protein
MGGCREEALAAENVNSDACREADRSPAWARSSIMAMPRNSGDEVRSGQGRIMDYTALASGLIGAIIGALSSWVTLIVQNHYQNRRDRTRLLYETAYKDYELRIRELPENIATFPVILDYHQQMMNLIDKDNLTPATVKDVFGRQADMNAAVQRAVDSRQGPASQPEGQT